MRDEGDGFGGIAVRPKQRCARISYASGACKYRQGPAAPRTPVSWECGIFMRKVHVWGRCLLGGWPDVETRSPCVSM